ncbi:MAG: hypothetical protein QG556_370 [Pseudomonadota bacterium]|nr:hypothetical protein [Pseudomonadota bacterium]
MGLDYSCYVKSSSGNMIRVNDGNLSRYFGMYDGRLYDRGNFTDVITTLLDTCDDYRHQTVYYGHDHQDQSEYVPVTPELIYELTKLWFENVRGIK